MFSGNDGKLTSAKLNDLYKKLDDIANSTKEIQNLTNVAKSVVRQTEVNVTAAEQMTDQATKILMVRVTSGWKFGG